MLFAKLYSFSGQYLPLSRFNMADRHNAPKLSKKRKLGKNKKKSWRVSKADDIEEFLEDERQQIRTGYKIYS